MNANKLMIGDQVDFYHPYEPEKKIVTKHRITEIYECGLVGISNHPNPVHADHIEPVKITREILEKNGFEQVKEKWVYSNDYYNITIYEWSDSIWVWRYESTEMNVPYEQRVIFYVNELQHALKECGFGKEIVL